MAKKITKKTAPDNKPRVRAKRMPAAGRKAAILSAAIEFFSKNGFRGSTRVFADSMGIRQALIYKYFSDKQDLIEQTLATAFGADAPGLEIEAADLEKFFAKPRELSRGRFQRPCNLLGKGCGVCGIGRLHQLHILLILRGGATGDLVCPLAQMGAA